MGQFLAYRVTQLVTKADGVLPSSKAPPRLVSLLLSAQSGGLNIPQHLSRWLPYELVLHLVARICEPQPSKPHVASLLAAAHLHAPTPAHRARALQMMVSAGASGAKGAALVLCSEHAPGAEHAGEPSLLPVSTEDRLGLVRPLAGGDFPFLAAFLNGETAFSSGSDTSSPLGDAELQRLFKELPRSGPRLNSGQESLPHLLRAIAEWGPATQEAALAYLESAILQAKRQPSQSLLAWREQATKASPNRSNLSNVVARLERLILAAGGNPAAELLCLLLEDHERGKVPEDLLNSSLKPEALQNVDDAILVRLAKNLVGHSTGIDEPFWWNNLVEASKTSAACNEIIQLWNTAHGRKWLGTTSVAVPHQSKEGPNALRYWRPFFQLVARQGALAAGVTTTVVRQVEGQISLRTRGSARVPMVIDTLNGLWAIEGFEPALWPLVEAWLITRYPVSKAVGWPEPLWAAWIEVLDPSSDAGWETLTHMIGRLADSELHAGVVQQAASALIEALPTRNAHHRPLKEAQINGLLEALNPHATHGSAAEDLIQALGQQRSTQTE
jgi:hypothetical protein